MAISAEEAKRMQEEIDHDASESAYSCELEYQMAYQIQEMLKQEEDASGSPSESV